MKLKNKLAIVSVVVIGIVGVALFNKAPEEIVYKEEAKSVIVDNMASIRSREDIRRQQELIVEEAYLLEERTKLQASLKEVETKLDGVRKEKVSFE